MLEKEKDLIVEEVETTVEEVKEVDVVEEVEVEEVVEEPAKEEQPTVPTFESLEEYNKVLQSTASKAKNELLKEIGINNVNEIKEKIALAATIEPTVQELAMVKEELEQLKGALKAKEDQELARTFGIEEEYTNTFIGMVDAIDDDNLSRVEKAQKVKEQLLAMVKNDLAAKPIGVEKTNEQEINAKEEQIKKAMGLK